MVVAVALVRSLLIERKIIVAVGVVDEESEDRFPTLIR
jgi:hypothetical protein